MPTNSARTIPVSLADSIYDTRWHAFFRAHKIFNRFIEERRKIELFLTDVLNDGSITINDLNDFLYSEIFWSQQKYVAIRNIEHLDASYFTAESLSSLLSISFPDLTHPLFNHLADIAINDNLWDFTVAAAEICSENGQVNMLRFVLVAPTQVIVDRVTKAPMLRYLYIPIEIDLVNNLVISKVRPLSYTAGDHSTPQKKMKNATEYLLSRLRIDIECDCEPRKVALFNLCNKIVESNYETLRTNRPPEINAMANSFAQDVLSIININNLEGKRISNNVYDLGANVIKQIDNLMITDMIRQETASNNSTGLGAYAYHVKFSDGRRTNAALSGDTSKDSILESNAFLGLRATIENSGKIAELSISMVNQSGNRYRLRYDASAADFLFLHFFSDLSEEEFQHAFNEYTQCLPSTLDASSQLA